MFFRVFKHEKRAIIIHLEHEPTTEFIAFPAFEW